MIKQAPFKPTDIGGCQLWLDGADSTSASMILSGSNVSTWIDKSSNGYTGTSSGSPVLVANSQNGLSCISFNSASSQYFNFGNVIPQTQQSIFFVGKSTYVNGTSQSFIAKGLLGGQLGRWGLIWDASVGNYLNYLVDGAANTLATITSYSGVCSIFEGVWDGTTSYVYGNGTQIGSVGYSAVGTSNTDLVLVGAYNNASGGVPPASGFYYNGTMCEILVFNNAVTTPQRQQIESYLAQKWGLRQQLPQGHPGTRGIVYPSQPIPTAIYWRYPSAFVPTQIQPGTCQLWLDAFDSSSVTVSGTNVISVRDKSGKGVVLSNATGYSYPNNSFNGSYPSFLPTDPNTISGSSTATTWISGHSIENVQTSIVIALSSALGTASVATAGTSNSYMVRIIILKIA
jgi:hypothetical protein